MDIRETYIKNIDEKLSYLKNKIELKGKQNLTDSHVIAEDFYKDLFNLLGKFGTDFTNANEEKANSPFIDLIDKKTKTAIQVTANNSSEKISESIEGFFKNQKHEGFRLLVLLISKEAKNYRKDFTLGGRYSFNKDDDIIDIPKLIILIKKNSDTLEKISNYLDKQLNPPRQKTESDEVETIMALIDFLSKEKNRTPLRPKKEVDPNKKINVRFKTHAEFIKKQYIDIYSLYYTPLQKGKKKMIDSVKAITISSYLETESDEFLENHNNNPKLALNSLVNYFYDKLSENSFLSYDKTAIKFFLLHELTECNVFPNTK